LHALLSSGYGSIKSSTITCLVRGKEKAKALEELGVKTVLFTGLDETDVLAKTARDNDGKLKLLFKTRIKHETG
jgi:hypothetical protein